jgi:hypothetical protein
MRPQAREEIGIEPLPDIQRTESDALLFLEHMSNALGGGADDAKRKSATDPKGQPGERGNLTPSQGRIGVLPILALDSPELAVVGLSDEINALIGDRQLEFLRHRRRHFTVQPDMPELARIFGLQQQVGFDEFLEYVALLLIGRVAQPASEVVP